MRSARDGAVALATVLARTWRHRRSRAARRDRGGDELARPGPAQLAAGGPRAAGHEARVRAAARDDPRGLAAALRGAARGPSDDPDLALLLGDQLYALGLARLAELGDLDAVAELADLISLSPRRTRPESAADASWRRSGAPAAIGVGAARRRARGGRRRCARAARRALRWRRCGWRGSRGASLVTPASLLTVGFGAFNSAYLPLIEEQHVADRHKSREIQIHAPTGRCRAPSRARPSRADVHGTSSRRAPA